MQILCDPHLKPDSRDKLWPPSNMLLQYMSAIQHVQSVTFLKQTITDLHPYDIVYTFLLNTSYKYPLLCWLKSYGVMKSQLSTLEKMCDVEFTFVEWLTLYSWPLWGHGRIFNPLTCPGESLTYLWSFNSVSWKLCECTSRLRFSSD